MLSRRLICLIWLVLITALAGSVQAETVQWTDADPGDHLWSTAGNWDTGNLPTTADWAKIKNGAPGATIASAGAVALKVHIGYNYGSALTVDGGILTTVQDLALGKDGNIGTLNMISGTINVGRDFELGLTELGIVNMTGGTINVADDLMIPDVDSAFTGELNLDGGTIIVNGDLTMTTAGVNITAGTLIVNGDVTSTINSYISNGWLTAYGGTGTLTVDTTTNPGKTTVTAYMPTEPPTKATNPNPTNGATDVLIAQTLSWTPGTGAASHDVYFGIDATPDATEFQGNQTETTFALGILDPNTSYYWRIDEKNGFGTTGGDVWSFTTGATTSEIVIVPSGTSDDADLIQTTLDGLQNGDTLRLNGDFVIAHTIYLPSNFYWVLNGSLTLGDNAVANLDECGWVEPGIDARRETVISETPGGATNIDMSGGTYYGNYAHNTESHRFLNFVSVTNSYFHDFVVTDTQDDGFTVGPGSNNNELRNLIGSYSATGNALTDKGDHNRWYDCIAEDCGSDGWTPKCRNSEFYRCIARRNEGPGFGMFCRIDGSGNPVDLGEAIDDNKFYACESYENNAAGFSFNISSTSGEGGSIQNNYVEAKCYNNASSGVRFRNKMPNSIVANNEINLFCYGNRGEKKDGSLSSLAGGLGTDASYPVTHITGSIVGYDNIQWDVNIGQATECTITAYHPDGENPPVLKIGDPNSTITVIDFDCSDPLVEWCMQEYCGLHPCAGLADFDCDGNVDIDDVSYMAGVWLTDDSTADIALPADGIVNLPDLSILSQEWLP